MFQLFNQPARKCYALSVAGGIKQNVVERFIAPEIGDNLWSHKWLHYTILLSCFFLFIFATPISAQEQQEYKAGYQAEYFPDLNGDSQVHLNIKITNLRSDVYVKEFSLNFPTSFAIENITVRDDQGEITPNIENQERNFKVKLAFISPNTGRNSENNFYLTFLQKNLFKINENVWEIILPVISDQYDSPYNIVFHLPKNSNKKLSLAKPKPNLIRNNIIYWNNVKTKTIYAVFGESQFYQVDLTYHLKNNKLFPVYFDVAFPPETLYQKIFLTSIQPRPEKIYLDEDGNYLGRYTLKAKEKTQITFNGFIQTYVEPQEKLLDYIRENISNQKKYLLTPQPFWILDKEIIESSEFEKLKYSGDIYNYVTNILNYNYKRLNKKNERLGANQVWKQPDEAVCVEFTDLFIALAREKGIYAREINGYGFSDDPNLRPVSLISDTLHSWPEYFDEKKQIWIAVDPTWQNTSGIDYFDSLDLNHLAFVIHGKDSTLPLSAGMYKIEDSKDVSVKLVSALPKEDIKIKIDDDIRPEILDKNIYKAKIQITNEGNIFIKNYSIKWETENLEIHPQKTVIYALAPYQTYSFEINYNSRVKNINKEEVVNLFLNDNSYKIKKIKIISFYHDLFNKILAILTGIVFLLIVYLLIKKYEINKRKS